MDESEAELRYERERAFHDHRFGEDDSARARTEKYYAVNAGNAAYTSEVAALPSGARVLEYGCGPGSAAFDLAGRGVDVIGIDISPVAIEAARAEAEARGLTTVTFEQMNAEALTFADASFDAVCGSGVLHHLDLARAWREVSRVLRPGGTAVFLEPMGTNPMINLYRRLTPNLRTPDEHPLLFADFVAAQRFFGQVFPQFFNLFGLAGAFLGRIPKTDALVRRLQALDRWLFARLPGTRRLAWVVVLTLRDPRPQSVGPSTNR